MNRRLSSQRLAAALTGIFAFAATTVLSPRSDRLETLSVGDQPLVAIHGAHSAITNQRYLCITKNERWRDLWVEHKGDSIDYSGQGSPICPKIDFDRCLVIAAFQGRSWNSDGEFVHSIADRKDDVLIRLDSHTYQTMEEGNRVTPFGIWVIPRPGKPIVLEENVQGLIGKPPVWKERARFHPEGH
jgi:hypothetical protein